MTDPTSFDLAKNGEYAAALSAAEIALTALRQQPNPDAAKIANAINDVGVAQHMLGRLAEAAESYGQAWTYASTTADHQTRGIVLSNQAEVACHLGNGVLPIALLDQAEAEFAETGPLPSSFVCGITLTRAIAAGLRGEPNLAEEFLLQGLAVLRQLGDPHSERKLLIELANLYEKSGADEAARSIREQLSP